MASEMDKLKEHIMAARKHSVQALTYLENSYEALEEEWKRLDNAKRLFANGASNSPGEKQRAVYNIINWKGAIPETHVESFKGTLGAKLVVMHDSVESLIANTGNVPTTLVIRREQMWRGETLSRAVKEFLANKGLTRKVIVVVHDFIDETTESFNEGKKIIDGVPVYPIAVTDAETGDYVWSDGEMKSDWKRSMTQ